MRNHCTWRLTLSATALDPNVATLRASQVPYLKVALLDYLKHKGSSDPDLYSMLTLNFNMHREIAENLESVAMTKIKRLANDGRLHFLSLLFACLSPMFVLCYFYMQ